MSKWRFILIKNMFLLNFKFKQFQDKKFTKSGIVRATVLTRVEYSGVLLWTFLWLGQKFWISLACPAAHGSVSKKKFSRKKVWYWFQNCLISKFINSFKMALLETSSLRNNVFNTIMSCHCMVDGCEFEGELSLIWQIAI